VTNIDFTDKTTGQNVFERYVVPIKHDSEPVQRSKQPRKTALKFGPMFELFALPENTSQLTAEIFDAGGRNVATYHASLENALRTGFPVDKKLHAGVFLVRLSCSAINGNGRALVAHRALMIR
jgi:hypothetical protein